MEITSSKIKTIAKETGFDLCGIASTEGYEKITVSGHPETILPECRSIIVVAKRFLNGSFDSTSTIPYTILRNQLSNIIDHKTSDLAYRIEEKGYSAVPTGVIEPCNWDKDLSKTVGLVSLKYAAYKAGLGVIGKNTLLITPEYGNRVWLGAILTSAELEPDPVIEYNPCKEGCRLCLDNCPVNALDGSEFMDQGKCWNHAFGQPEEGGEWRIKCFTCRSICPYSKGFTIKSDMKRAVSTA